MSIRQGEVAMSAPKNAPNKSELIVTALAIQRQPSAVNVFGHGNTGVLALLTEKLKPHIRSSDYYGLVRAWHHDQDQNSDHFKKFLAKLIGALEKRK